MSVLSGYWGAEAQKEGSQKASDAQVKSTKISTDAMMKMFGISREDTRLQRELFSEYAMPEWQKMFEGGLDSSVDLDLENDKVFQANRDQTERSLNRRAASTGKYSSSDADNAIARNMGNLTTDAYNRRRAEDSTSYGKLLDASKIGSGAAQSAGQNAMNTGQIVSQNALASGNAQAQNYLAQGQATSNYMNQVGQTGQNLWLAWMMNQE